MKRTWQSLNNQEYRIKLDSYYFDPRQGKTMLRLKIRNKRAISRLPVEKILNDKQSLSELHPIDLCIIGVLANSATNAKVFNGENNLPIPDDFIMCKIQPFVEVVSKDYTSSVEVITLKFTPLEQTISISAVELYRNKKLMSALRFQDALSLGFSTNITQQIINEKGRLSTPNCFSLSMCLSNGLLLSTLILSIFFSNKQLNFTLFQQSLFLKGEILFFPFIFCLEYIVIIKSGAIRANQVAMARAIALILFFLYFDLITKLPYSTIDLTTVAFATLYKTVKNHPLNYLLSLMITRLIARYTWEVIMMKWAYLNHYFQKNLIICFYSSVFFINSFIISLLMHERNYSWIDYAYCIILMNLLIIAEMFRNLACSVGHFFLRSRN